MKFILFLRFFHNPLSRVLDYGILACFTYHKQDSNKIKMLNFIEGTYAVKGIFEKHTITRLLVFNVYSKVSMVIWFNRTDVALCQVSI